MAVRCEFKNYSNGYECIIKNQEIPSEVSEETFQGVHEKNRTNDVRVLIIHDSKFEKIPDKIGEVFKNVTELCITKSKLKEISKENLRQFPNLKELNLSGNQLEYLPGDLFEFNKKLEGIRLSYNNIKIIGPELLDGLPNLETLSLEGNQLEYLPGDLFEFNQKLKWIELYNNKIKFIGPELLDGLPNLFVVNLENNENISNKFDRYYCMNVPSLTLQKLKEEIESKCKPPPELLLKLDKSIQLSKQEKKNEKNAVGVPVQNFCGQVSFLKDLNKLLTLDDFKDFTIKVDPKEFKVHKFIFIARSPIFAEMIKNNPDADELVLTDIPVEVFESILDFVYTDQPPNNPRNAREIFAAAGKLKIQSLMEVLAEILLKEMEDEENLDFLMENFNLGFKFECKKLKLKAFEGIKKQFPGGKLKNELLEDPENLKKLIEAKKFQDEFMVKEDVKNRVG